MKNLATTLAVCRHAAIHELDITRRLLSSNIFASMGFQTCVLVSRLFLVPVVHDPMLLLLRFILIAITSAYGFEICQQMMSVEEDRQNKPSRPIPAGLLSVQAAVRRCALSWVLSPLALITTVSIGASGWLVCSFAWAYFCYVWPRPQHWFFKNLFTAVYQLIFVRLVDSLLILHTPYTETKVVLDVFYTAWILATIHIQDFHDVEGDRKVGRRTLPVVLDGSTLVSVRHATAQFLSLFAIFAAIFGYRNNESRTVLSFAALQLAGAIATSLRLLRTESLEESERTYKLFYVPAGLILAMYLSLLNPVVCYANEISSVTSSYSLVEQGALRMRHDSAPDVIQEGSN
jgi:4-hydroxybenzoate polyprenyltransferase